MQDGRAARVTGILIARMDSSRLPGKVLMKVAGLSLLELAWRRAARAKTVDAFVLATSDRACDDPLASEAAGLGLPTFRGDVNDVAGRVAACAAADGATHFLRLNGDSPFPDADLIDAGVRLALAEGADIATNLRPRSYPYGVAVEVVKLATFQAALPSFAPSEREHVTQHIYLNPDRFSLRALPLASVPSLETVRLTVDEPADFARVGRIAAALGDRLYSAGYLEVVEAARTTAD
jgi:spore coat polysaccharide biosynthesis protein SpsF